MRKEATPDFKRINSISSVASMEVFICNAYEVVLLNFVVVGLLDASSYLIFFILGCY